MSTAELTAVVLRVRPDDTIVVSFPDRLSENQFQRASEDLKATFPDNRILILEGGADITVIRPDEDEIEPLELESV